jgi:4'-phosphopantetheinyl transferase
MLEKKQIESHHIHIWQVHLSQDQPYINELFLLLSEDEKQRANRFHFPIHQQRFIIARASLRTILASYIHQDPQDLQFVYTNHEKPFLKDTPDLQFNLSHSDDLAIYAITKDQALGIDIEKIKDEYHQGIVQRFFSANEQRAIEELSDELKPHAFYQIWAKKEAIVKTIGKGLNLPLSSFSVSLAPHSESIELDGYSSLQLFPLQLHDEYASAVCCQGVVQKISIYNIIGKISQLEKSYNFQIG